MTIRTLALATGSALAATVSLSAVASAADLNGAPTRNWGGTWFGFGAGYAKQSYKGNLEPFTTCVTNTTGNSLLFATCDHPSDGVVNVGALSASHPLVETSQSSAAAGLTGTNSAAATASAAGSGLTEASVDPSVPDASAFALGVFAANSDDARNVGGPSGVQSSAVLPADPTFGTASTSAFAYADPATGIYAAGAQASSNLSSAGTATAFGFGRLGMQGLSDSEGGFAPSIHMRHDYQTDSNWVIGGELDMTFTPDNTASLASDFLEFDGGSLGQTVEANTNLLASARLRLGYATGDYLFYGTGGVAFADFEATTTFDVAYGGITDTGRTSDTASKNAWGGVVGGGVSAFVAEDTVVSMEGLYYMFDETIDFDGTSVKLDDAFSVMVKVSIRPN